MPVTGEEYRRLLRIPQDQRTPEECGKISQVESKTAAADKWMQEQQAKLAGTTTDAARLANAAAERASGGAAAQPQLGGRGGKAGGMVVPDGPRESECGTAENYPSTKERDEYAIQVLTDLERVAAQDGPLPVLIDAWRRTKQSLPAPFCQVDCFLRLPQYPASRQLFKRFRDACLANGDDGAKLLSDIVYVVENPHPLGGWMGPAAPDADVDFILLKLQRELEAETEPAEMRATGAAADPPADRKVGNCLNFADVVALLRTEAKKPNAPYYGFTSIGVLARQGSIASGQAIDLQLRAAQGAGAFVGIEARNPQALPPLSHYLAMSGGYGVEEWLLADGDLPSAGTITLGDMADALENARTGVQAAKAARHTSTGVNGGGGG